VTTPRPRRPLSERVTQYPVSAPQDEISLINTDVEAILALGLNDEQAEVVLEHRRAVLDAIRSYERRPITSAEVVLEMLSGKYRLLQPLAGRWLTYVLNDRRERKLVPHPSRDGDMTYQNVVTRKVPTATQLRTAAPVPRGGVYLMLWGGSPDILSKWTVADEIAALRREVPVADVLFWHLETGRPGALYSLVKGQGDRGGELVDFPDPEALERARTTQ
jgi:hypothetical protein